MNDKIILLNIYNLYIYIGSSFKAKITEVEKLSYMSIINL